MNAVQEYLAAHPAPTVTWSVRFRRPTKGRTPLSWNDCWDDTPTTRRELARLLRDARRDGCIAQITVRRWRGGEVREVTYRRPNR